MEEKRRDYPQLIDKIQKIEISIAHMTSFIESEKGNVNLILNNMQKTLDKLDHNVSGNGRPGLLRDVDLLKVKDEESEYRQKWLWGVASGTLVGLLLLMIKVMFFK